MFIHFNFLILKNYFIIVITNAFYYKLYQKHQRNKYSLNTKSIHMHHAVSACMEQIYSDFVINGTLTTTAAAIVLGCCTHAVTLSDISG